MGPLRMIRVVLADDHNLVRAGLRVLLERLPDVEVVGEAENASAVVRAAVELRPDLVFLDIAMPGRDGLDAAAEIAQRAPATRVIVVSMHSIEDYVARALKLGVAGYITKDALPCELPRVIDAVMRGETYLSPKIATVVAAMRDAAGGLTPRQREILRLLAEGTRTKEIAHLLGLSVRTVECHRAQIMDRLGIRELAGLVKYAVRNGLTAPA